MSILINGMDMPNDYKHRDVMLDRTTDDGILRLSVYDFDHEARKYSCRVYPLSEIPTPHGDLIDRDKLIQLFLPIMEFPEDERIMYVDSFIRALKNAPTIIKAEG